MRITTANAYESAISQLQLRRQSLDEAQERLTSGKRVARPSDDPAAMARAERALAAERRSQAQGRALDAARATMGQGEAALGEAGNLLQMARDLAVQAGNGTLSDTDRAVLADSIRGLRDQLLQVANRDDGAGLYLFGGQGSDLAPFVDAPGGVAFRGSGGLAFGGASDPVPLTLPGAEVWAGAADPANAGQRLSVFTALDRLVADLATPGRSDTQVQATVATGLRSIDAVATTLASWRSFAGEALARIDRLDDRNQATELAARTERSLAEDLDMVAAISAFEKEQAGYSAALQTYATVQRQSLFDFIR
jgi:flagellar hook-associated protein 3 FlgL